MLRYLTILCLLLTIYGDAQAQAKVKKKMQKTQKNTMLCDTATGICAIPTHADHNTRQMSAGEKPVKITYFTDPICSFCWGIEPQLRKLKIEYGDVVEIEYRMGGLLPSWDIYNSGPISKPADVAHHWDEVSHYIEMPIDGDVWLEDPLPSSYPPSIAFKAAQLQNDEKALVFLRRIREMVFLEKKNIARWNHLAAAALESGLDTARLKQDYEGRGIQLLEQDLELTRAAGANGFPTLIFTNKEGRQTIINGARPYNEFVAAIQKLFPAAQKRSVPTDVFAVLKKLKTVTAKEYAVVFNVSQVQAENELKTMEDKKIATRYDTKNGALWRMNK
jgi:putative protein-disulfide isomerase